MSFEVAEKGFRVWQAHTRNLFSVLARRRGVVSMRLLRSTQDRRQHLMLATWAGKAAHDAALKSLEVKLALKALTAGNFTQKTAETRDFELLDLVWGRAGMTAFATPGIFVNHIEFEVIPEKFDEYWRPYARNFLSVLARQKGLVAEEIFRSLDNRYKGVALRSYPSKELSAVGPEFNPPREVKLATKPAEDFKVYDQSKRATYHDYQVVDVIVGPGGDKAYDGFINQLEAV